MIRVGQEIRAAQRGWSDEIDFFLLKRAFENGRTTTTIALPEEQGFAFHKLEEGSRYPAPTLSMEREQAQSLIDQLWECGLRPSQGRQSQGQLAATEKHLADMRALAFAKLKVERPS